MGQVAPTKLVSEADTLCARRLFREAIVKYTEVLPALHCTALHCTALHCTALRGGDAHPHWLPAHSVGYVCNTSGIEGNTTLPTKPRVVAQEV